MPAVTSGVKVLRTFWTASEVEEASRSSACSASSGHLPLISRHRGQDLDGASGAGPSGTSAEDRRAVGVDDDLARDPVATDPAVEAQRCRPA